jgi:isopentenyl phosphate kinase
MEEAPDLQLLIGHGSGSFGHAIAGGYQTQKGGWGDPYWQGFSEVWRAARELNQIVVEIFHLEGLPLIAFPPSASVIAENKQFSSWDLHPIRFALSQGLIPLVQGDVIFDTGIGGTIFSTEKCFQYLSKYLHPQKILLVGIDKGVYKDVSEKNEVFSLITPTIFKEIQSIISGSDAVDVTGGMIAKVELMLAIVQEQNDLQAQIFSGEVPGNIIKALQGQILGTLIRS